MSAVVLVWTCATFHDCNVERFMLLTQISNDAQCIRRTLNEQLSSANSRVEKDSLNYAMNKKMYLDRHENLTRSPSKNKKITNNKAQAVMEIQERVTYRKKLNTVYKSSFNKFDNNAFDADIEDMTDECSDDCF